MAYSRSPPGKLQSGSDDDLNLVGIVGHLPGGALALVRRGKTIEQVAVGGLSGDWTLKELSPTDAVFERDGVRRVVELPDVE